MPLFALEQELIEGPLAGRQAGHAVAVGPVATEGLQLFKTGGIAVALTPNGVSQLPDALRQVIGQFQVERTLDFAGRCQSARSDRLYRVVEAFSGRALIFVNPVV